MPPPKASSSTAGSTPKHPKTSLSTTSHPITPPLNPDGSLIHPIPEKFYSGSGTASTNDHEDASVMSEDGSEGGGGGGGRRGRGVAATATAGEINFQALAMKHAGFAKVLKRNGQVDFSEPESVKQLTLALALTNHALDLVLPDNRLCPPIPNRFNYILFLQRLLNASLPLTASQYLDSADTPRGSSRESSNETRDILGVDIGTGASAIYPLLALRQCASWRMVATEIDQESIGYARENVKRNGLGGRCMVVPAQAITAVSDEEDGHDDGYNERQWLFPHHEFLHNASLQNHQRVDFVMTNPPFYTSKHEMLESEKLKKRPPNSACTGVEGEMVYADGGEVGWVKRMIEESALLLRRRRVRVQWWTTTLGKLSSVAKIVELLREKGCGNYVAVEFVQGTKTKRWAVGWSWEGWRVVTGTAGGGGGSEDEMSGIRGLERRLWPVSTDTQWAVEVPSQNKANTRQERGAVDVVGALVDEIVEELDDGGDSDDDDHDDNMEAEEPSKRHTSSNKPPGFSWRWSVRDRTGVGVSVQGDCWSRKARRAKEMLLRKRTRLQDGDGDEQMKDAMHGAVGRKEAGGGDGGGHDDTEPKFVFRIAVTQGGSPSAADLTVRWLFGEDAVLFESFCGMLRRKVREGLS